MSKGHGSAAPRIGLIGSSGGSTFNAMIDCLTQAEQEHQFFVLVDRECGTESVANERGYPVRREKYCDATSFSKKSSEFFLDNKCDAVLLLYTRRVTCPLIDNISVWNIHPAILPSFRGLGGISQAVRENVRIFGATLHRVDAGLDTGPICAQTASARSEDMSTARINRISYIQKTALGLVFYEHLARKSSNTPMYVDWETGNMICSPGISDAKIRNSFLNWAKQTEHRDPVE